MSDTHWSMFMYALINMWTGSLTRQTIHKWRTDLWLVNDHILHLSGKWCKGGVQVRATAPSKYPSASLFLKFPLPMPLLQYQEISNQPPLNNSHLILLLCCITSVDLIQEAFCNIGSSIGSTTRRAIKCCWACSVFDQGKCPTRQIASSLPHTFKARHTHINRHKPSLYSPKSLVELFLLRFLP